jgi:hypothetical protein
MDGMGVLIGRLCGNAETVDAHNGAIGKTIARASLTDDQLCLSFTDGTGIRFYDDGQSCCESRYMVVDDSLSEYQGAIFHGAELKQAPNQQDEYGDHEVQFLEIKTSKGAITAASHNEHNGYYGGFNVVVRSMS